MIATAEHSALSIPLRSQPLAGSGIELIVDWFHEFAGLIGIPCSCFERHSRRVIAQFPLDSMPYTPLGRGRRVADTRTIEIQSIGGGLLYFLVPVLNDNRFVVDGFAKTSETTSPIQPVVASLDSMWDEGQIRAWLETVPVCDEQILKRLLTGSLQLTEQHRRAAWSQLEIRSLNQQIDYTRDQISLLHSLAHNLHLSRPTEELAQLCLSNLQHLIDCAGTVICFQDQERRSRFLMQGQLPFDEAGFVRLLARFEQHDWSRPLVENKLENSLVGADFPGLKNLMIASIGDESHRYGWIVTCNLRGGCDFEEAEARLVGSISTILGTHARNIQLFEDHSDLLISFVRSLVSSIDAKDPHTRGHSERVALLARRLGEQLGLSAQELDDLALSSLLHDLGKIGVDDRILSKPGRLTREEFQQIKQHPLIGYQILSPLKNLKSILPGVRSHHEAYNGKGYPDRLRGEEIPLMARIISVVDSYDAMATDRPYRKGMPLAELEEIFRRGSGEQWDPRIIDAYFAARNDIRQLFASCSQTAEHGIHQLDLSRSGIFSSPAGTKPGH